MACYMDSPSVGRQIRLGSIALGRSVKSLWDAAIRRFGAPYTREEIASLFDVPEYLWNRKPFQLGHHTARFCASLGFLQKKRIYVYPWIGGASLREMIYSPFLPFLARQDCLVLIPASKRVEPLNPDCHLIDMISLYPEEIRAAYE